MCDTHPGQQNHANIGPYNSCFRTSEGIAALGVCGPHDALAYLNFPEDYGLWRTGFPHTEPHDTRKRASNNSGSIVLLSRHTPRRPPRPAGRIRHYGTEASAASLAPGL